MLEAWFSCRTAFISLSSDWIKGVKKIIIIAIFMALGSIGVLGYLFPDKMPTALQQLVENFEPETTRSSDGPSQSAGAKGEGASPKASILQSNDLTQQVEKPANQRQSGSEANQATEHDDTSEEVVEIPVIKPAFDVVRVEKDGSMLIAGTASPGADIKIELNGEVIAKTTSDVTGAFVALPTDPIKGKDNDIRVRALSGDGREALSDQTIAIAVVDGEGPLVAVLEPGKAIKILQKPEATTLTDANTEKDRSNADNLDVARLENGDFPPSATSEQNSENKNQQQGEGTAVAKLQQSIPSSEITQPKPKPLAAVEAGQFDEPSLDVDDSQPNQEDLQVVANNGATAASESQFKNPETRRIARIVVEPQPGEDVELEAPAPPAVPVEVPALAVEAQLEEAPQPEEVDITSQPARETQEGEILAQSARSTGDDVPQKDEASPAVPEIIAETAIAQVKKIDEVSPVIDTDELSETPKAPEVSVSNETAKATEQQVDSASSDQTENDQKPLNQAKISTSDASLPNTPPPNTPTPNTPPPSTPTSDIATAQQATLAVEAVEVEDDKIFIAGVAKPDEIVRIYVDDENLGDTKTAPSGRWLYEDRKELAPGNYAVRVDQVEDGTGVVSARAQVSFVIEDLVTEGGALPPGSDVIIRRNDNLWTIAQRLYGSGTRFTSIYQQNKGQIRDPDLIFPGQVFSLPQEGLAEPQGPRAPVRQ